MNTLMNRQLHRSETHKQGSDPACPVCQRLKQVSEVILQRTPKTARGREINDTQN
jgi:hypothetical protein